ncbi:MAG: hypothetical protein NTY12_03285 [Candidatus Falkowbacteria bacterium]|nr:hypothetical protein [Candidatus Falkowbacteria bacterium]
MEQTNIQLNLEDLLNNLKKSDTKLDCLKLAYNIISKRYHGQRLYTVTHLFNIFNNNIEHLLQSSGTMHCTNINHLLRFLLISSGIFSKEDIKTRWTLLWFISPHQYLEVKTEDGLVKVDIWARNFGIEFGDYAHGWHLKTE